MSEVYAVIRTQHAAEIVLGEIRFEANTPRIEKGEVKAVLSVWNGALLHQGSINLSSVRTRGRLIATLAEKGVTVDDGALVALEQGCRRHPPKHEKAAPEPVAPENIEPGHAVLDAVYGYVGRFVAYPSAHARVAHALWIVHTHLMDAWTSTPRLAALSPEPASGKTRLLEVTELLVPNPVEAINVTPAYLFRKVGHNDGPPTILFDEIDTVFGPKAKDNEEIRGLLNAGHRRGAVAGRCVVRGEIVETEEIPAYCAVAVAGLGDLPDTILTRSVIIKMRRRAGVERIEAFRRRVEEPTGHALRDRIAAWAVTVAGELADAWPKMPEGVTDRDADVWESLLAVADAAGGGWPERARVAAVALVADSKESTPSLGIRLLSDLRTVFGNRSAMATDAILKALHGLDEAPWAEVAKGEPLNARGLSQRLKPYGVSSKTIRIEKETPKGYRREDLADAWSRYLPSPPHESATSATSATSAPEEPSVAQAPSHQNAFTPNVADVADVADSKEDGRVCVQCNIALPTDWPTLYCADHGGTPNEGAPSVAVNERPRCLVCRMPLLPGEDELCAKCEARAEAES